MASYAPFVAPHRGERGLKSKLADIALHLVAVAPHRGERGLKSKLADIALHIVAVAPHRGERGLKLKTRRGGIQAQAKSLPIVGSVD